MKCGTSHIFLFTLWDWDEMSNLYRRPSIVASYQVSVHLAMRFQRRRFKKICQSETRIACGDHVCQRIGTKCLIVSVTKDLSQMTLTKLHFIWLRRFRGEDKNVKSKQMTDDGRWVPRDGKSQHCLPDTLLQHYLSLCVSSRFQVFYLYFQQFIYSFNTPLNTLVVELFNICFAVQ